MQKPRKALFLDRDGVINVERGYVWRIADFAFMDGIFDLCHAAKEKGFLLIVATNQSGIGRGLYTEDDFATLTAWMMQRFAEKGAPLDAVYYCPYHPDDGIGHYRRYSFDRKPNPGMLLRAQREFGLDMAASVLIGDNERDIEAGKAAGVGKAILLQKVPVSIRADHRIIALDQATALLT